MTTRAVIQSFIEVQWLFNGCVSLYMSLHQTFMLQAFYILSIVIIVPYQAVRHTFVTWEVLRCACMCALDMCVSVGTTHIWEFRLFWELLLPKWCAYVCVYVCDHRCWVWLASVWQMDLPPCSPHVYVPFSSSPSSSPLSSLFLSVSLCLFLTHTNTFSCFILLVLYNILTHHMLVGLYCIVYVFVAKIVYGELHLHRLFPTKLK